LQIHKGLGVLKQTNKKTLRAVFVLKVRPSWVNIELQEWKRLTGLIVRVLFNQTNKQTNKKSGEFSNELDLENSQMKKSGEFSDELDLKLGPQMQLSVKSQSEGTIQYVPEF